ncbi:hypothetical protein F5883DRAFT_260776 [Diaporthe sp. PMI_573]|jgi:hypothetical protein|nr:hypothetical protein F5883DRAFT_260776 [Diaporthaceae sp. PMI_573]
MAAGYGQGMWGNSQRVVEELGTGDDTDTQGVGLGSGRRFSSDPLRFTGIDAGESMVRSRRRAYEQPDDDDDTSESDQDSEMDAESETQLALREKENALVESALRRIRRAQAKGKQEVKLNKKELAALEQRRKRMQAEAGGSKKNKKEQRYAVPLSQLGPISQKENRALVAPDDTLPPHPSPGTFERTQEGRLQPPVGWFAHPPSSRPGTADSRESRRSSGRASDREPSSSPFQYSYVQPSSSPSNPRHSSDPSLRHRSSRGPLPHEESWMPQYGASASTSSIPSASDPFRYMTSGPQAPYHAGTTAGPRNLSGSSLYLDPRAGNAPRRQSRRISPDDTESEDSDDEGDTSDDMGAGARIGVSNVGPSSGRDQIIVEEEREPTPPPRPVTRSKKGSSATSSPKRKPVGGGTGRKKKGSK